MEGYFLYKQACKIVIEPVFEANFQDCSYGFRPKLSAQEAVLAVKQSLYYGWWVVDADIKNFFNNMNHDILISLLRRRISDRKVLKLIKKWLKAGVIENGIREKTDIGSPQGAVISPLLQSCLSPCNHSSIPRIYEKVFRNSGKRIFRE